MVDPMQVNSDAMNVISWVVGAFGGIITILLGVLIAQTAKVRVDLTKHILNMANVLPGKVSKEDCTATRHECVALNRQIIHDPLKREIDEIRSKRKERWQAQAEENFSMWSCIKTHSHTKIPEPERDNVIIKKR